MRKPRIRNFHMLPAIIALAIVLGGGVVQNIGAQEKQADNSGWIPLFDGRTLTGWENPYDWGEAWVEDGEIRLRGPKKFFLCTTRPFRDFEFEAEVRMPPEGRANSGFMFRCHKRRNRVFGYQAEVDPSPRAWSGGLYDEGRRGWIWPRKPNNSTAAKEFRARTQGAFRRDAWNRYRIVCRGDHIQIYVNGVACTDLYDAVDREGYIALQHHGEKGQVYRFRNIRIRELPPPPAPVDLPPDADLLRSPPPRIRDTLGARCPQGGTVLLDERSGLDAWTSARHPGQPPGWKLEKGVLTVTPGTGSIITRKTFRDFRLHVEFNVNEGRPGQDNGNSGVYLLRRYEVQILNSFGMPGLRANECGAIYKVKAADVNACRPPGAWQTYDIEFRAPRWDAQGRKTRNARITVYQDGIRIHECVEVPHKTGAGRPESPAPGPILLQDHGDPVRFRNIWIIERPSAAP